LAWYSIENDIAVHIGDRLSTDVLGVKAYGGLSILSMVLSTKNAPALSDIIPDAIIYNYLALPKLIDVLSRFDDSSALRDYPVVAAKIGEEEREIFLLKSLNDVSKTVLSRASAVIVEERVQNPQRLVQSNVPIIVGVKHESVPEYAVIDFDNLRVV